MKFHILHFAHSEEISKIGNAVQGRCQNVFLVRFQPGAIINQVQQTFSQFLIHRSPFLLTLHIFLTVEKHFVSPAFCIVRRPLRLRFKMSIGVPIKVLHEAEGHIITCETNTGEIYRGKLVEAEDNMNCQMTGITVTYRYF